MVDFTVKTIQLTGERDAEMGKVHSLYLLLAQFTRIQPDLDTDLFRPTPFVLGIFFKGAVTNAEKKLTKAKSIWPSLPACPPGQLSKQTSLPQGVRNKDVRSLPVSSNVSKQEYFFVT